MKTRLITSLALPAAMATAGLLNTAEAAFANSPVMDKKSYGDSSHQKASRGDDHHCPPIGNLTWFDYDHGKCDNIGNIPWFDHGYGHHCPPMGNVTIVDYGHHCPPVANSTFFDFGQPVIVEELNELPLVGQILESLLED